MDITLPYIPRDAFVPFHQRNNRFSAMVCHRRAGKTVACINDLVIKGLRSKRKKARYAYIGPYRQQAKEIAWEYLKEATEGFRKGPPRVSELKVALPNDATIQIYGADNAEAIRGLYFDGVILDEYGDYRPSIWGEIILPTLLERNGWAVFIGTMKGKNHFYKQLKRAETEPSWFYMKLKASESNILTSEQLQIMKDESTDEQYQQEMECNPDAAVMGTYYSKIIANMEHQGSIGSYPYNPDEMVHASADLGYTDSTAFWFWQLDKEGPILIDYEEHDGQSLDYYMKMLKDKGYEYADIWLPHDAQAKTLQTGRSTIEQLVDPKGDGSRVGGLPCKLVPRLAIQHGIDAARMILPKVRIDANNCAAGIEALRAYRRQYNEKTQQYANTPLHDWSSNGADAFRGFALVTDTELSEKQIEEEEDPLLKPVEYKLAELFEEREKNWRSQILRI